MAGYGCTGRMSDASGAERVVVMALSSGMRKGCRPVSTAQHSKHKPNSTIEEPAQHSTPSAARYMSGRLILDRPPGSGLFQRTRVLIKSVLRQSVDELF